MKFGEIIDYMMENEIVSTIKTNDGKAIIEGEKYTHADITNSKSLYMLTVTCSTGVVSYQILELSKLDWEKVNHSTENKLNLDKMYRNLSYEYENVFGERKTSVREFNSIANINRRCKYNGDNLITINFH